jgi:hypothetical protein
MEDGLIACMLLVLVVILLGVIVISPKPREINRKWEMEAISHGYGSYVINTNDVNCLKVEFKWK